MNDMGKHSIHRRRRLRVLGVLWAMAMCAPVAAEDQIAACIDCHRFKGVLAEQLPRIEGQNAEYLLRQLGNFRDTHRKGFPMTVMAGSLTPEQMQSLATELSTRPWDTAPHAVDAIAAQAGEPLARALACSHCHGPTYRGAGALPRLAGQNPEYLARQLRAFDQGHRQLSMPEAAASMKRLSTAEINALAHHLASLDGQVHLDWLAGTWCSSTPTQRSELWWTEPRGGVMLGMQRDIVSNTEQSNKPTSFDYLRIELGDGAAVYQYQPGGHSAVTFKLVEIGASSAVFYKTGHDYPNRVRYQRTGDTLTALLDNGRGDEVIRFEWARDCAQNNH
jgi:cytochrome c553